MIVCLDTNIVIYVVEKNPTWEAKAAAKIAALVAGGDQIGICDPTRLECLLKPLASGDAATWENAARLGAKFNFKAMDSLHLATAVGD